MSFKGRAGCASDGAAVLWLLCGSHEHLGREDVLIAAVVAVVKVLLQLFEQTRIDAVILDYRMKGMDGATAKMIRCKLPRIPILVLSAYTTELPNGLTRVANSVIQKGEATSSLGKVLDDLLDRGSTGNRNSR